MQRGVEVLIVCDLFPDSFLDDLQFVDLFNLVIEAPTVLITQHVAECSSVSLVTQHFRVQLQHLRVWCLGLQIILRIETDQRER